MNFIFDIGNVLINFKPLSFLEDLFSDQPVVDKMNETIFKSREWAKLDQGIMTREEAQDIFCTREPDFQQEIDLTMQNLKNMLTPIPDTIALLPEIKEAGHDLYYLSNMHAEFCDYLLETYPFFCLFDGGIFSCDVRINKPAPKIYQLLLQTYQLDPEECLFFDDVEENVLAASKEGIRGVLFTGAECVSPFLNS